MERFSEKKFILDFNTVLMRESLFVVTSQVDSTINRKLRDVQTQSYHESTRYRVFFGQNSRSPNL